MISPRHGTLTCCSIAAVCFHFIETVWYWTWKGTGERKQSIMTNLTMEAAPGASSGNMLCLHLLIGHRVWQRKRLPCWRGPSVNLALGERFHRQWLGCQPPCPKQGIVSAEECSVILADPRCVLNIKSSAVIPLAAPNTNRGLPVAVATALLSNIASSSSASLWASLFSFTSLLFAHVFFLPPFFCASHV